MVDGNLPIQTHPPPICLSISTIKLKKKKKKTTKKKKKKPLP